MIVRIWRGWTAPSNADQYERVLTQQVIPAIAERGIPGVAGPAVLRREVNGEVEFTTMMTFEDGAGVEAFGGADGAAVVPEQARAVLARFDEYSVHCNLIGGALTVERPGAAD
jgi:hypothetical protein